MSYLQRHYYRLLEGEDYAPRESAISDLATQGNYARRRGEPQRMRAQRVNTNLRTASSMIRAMQGHTDGLIYAGADVAVYAIYDSKGNEVSGSKRYGYAYVGVLVSTDDLEGHATQISAEKTVGLIIPNPVLVIVPTGAFMAATGLSESLNEWIENYQYFIYGVSTKSFMGGGPGWGWKYASSGVDVSRWSRFVQTVMTRGPHESGLFRNQENERAIMLVSYGSDEYGRRAPFYVFAIPEEFTPGDLSSRWDGPMPDGGGAQHIRDLFHELPQAEFEQRLENSMTFFMESAETDFRSGGPQQLEEGYWQVLKLSVTAAKYMWYKAKLAGLKKKIFRRAKGRELEEVKSRLKAIEDKEFTQPRARLAKQYKGKEDDEYRLKAGQVAEKTVRLQVQYLEKVWKKIEGQKNESATALQRAVGLDESLIEAGAATLTEVTVREGGRSGMWFKILIDTIRKNKNTILTTYAALDGDPDLVEVSLDLVERAGIPRPYALEPGETYERAFELMNRDPLNEFLVRALFSGGIERQYDSNYDPYILSLATLVTLKERGEKQLLKTIGSKEIVEQLKRKIYGWDESCLVSDLEILEESLAFHCALEEAKVMDMVRKLSDARTRYAPGSSSLQGEIARLERALEKDDIVAAEKVLKSMEDTFSFQLPRDEENKKKFLSIYRTVKDRVLKMKEGKIKGIRGKPGPAAGVILKAGHSVLKKRDPEYLPVRGRERGPKDRVSIARLRKAVGDHLDKKDFARGIKYLRSKGRIKGSSVVIKEDCSIDDQILLLCEGRGIWKAVKDTTKEVILKGLRKIKSWAKSGKAEEKKKAQEAIARYEKAREKMERELEQAEEQVKKIAKEAGISYEQAKEDNRGIFDRIGDAFDNTMTGLADFFDKILPSLSSTSGTPHEREVTSVTYRGSGRKVATSESLDEGFFKDLGDVVGDKARKVGRLLDKVSSDVQGVLKKEWDRIKKDYKEIRSGTPHWKPDPVFSGFQAVMGPLQRKVVAFYDKVGKYVKDAVKEGLISEEEYRMLMEEFDDDDEIAWGKYESSVMYRLRQEWVRRVREAEDQIPDFAVKEYMTIGVQSDESLAAWREWDKKIFRIIGDIQREYWEALPGKYADYPSSEYYPFLKDLDPFRFPDAVWEIAVEAKDGGIVTREGQVTESKQEDKERTSKLAWFRRNKHVIPQHVLDRAKNATPEQLNHLWLQWKNMLKESLAESDFCEAYDPNKETRRYVQKLKRWLKKKMSDSEYARMQEKCKDMMSVDKGFGEDKAYAYDMVAEYLEGEVRQRGGRVDESLGESLDEYYLYHGRNKPSWYDRMQKEERKILDWLRKNVEEETRQRILGEFQEMDERNDEEHAALTAKLQDSGEYYEMTLQQKDRAHEPIEKRNWEKQIAFLRKEAERHGYGKKDEAIQRRPRTRYEYFMAFKEPPLLYETDRSSLPTPVAAGLGVIPPIILSDEEEEDDESDQMSGGPIKEDLPTAVFLTMLLLEGPQEDYRELIAWWSQMSEYVPTFFALEVENGMSALENRFRRELKSEFMTSEIGTPGMTVALDWPMEKLLDHHVVQGTMAFQTFMSEASRFLARKQVEWENKLVMVRTTKSHMSLLKNLSFKTGKSIQELERMWQQAIDNAETKLQDVDPRIRDKSKWAIAMRNLKKMLGLDTRIMNIGV